MVFGATLRNAAAFKANVGKRPYDGKRDLTNQPA
jgi:hypothetical protein